MSYGEIAADMVSILTRETDEIDKVEITRIQGRWKATMTFKTRCKTKPRPQVYEIEPVSAYQISTPGGGRPTALRKSRY